MENNWTFIWQLGVWLGLFEIAFWLHETFKLVQELHALHLPNKDGL